ncbi:hypothetical protein EX895_003605 [Sporisorium graminicola]|uniref:glucan endo-1,3-beta-D-glucosidase n=1 Tax=Sporisorium graminicola TaxID=280036 RepID=A0A4U7KSX6_9BASI|nr:hypothetical protein EX895_003605 [Sporisorium graminicola]TKY87591.1 hypothetical protein EX895_003605 [Sporisorium graminicola]
MAARYTAPSYDGGGGQPYHSSASTSSHAHGSLEDGVDADTVDYWDNGPIPAPYRLSTAHAASPYPTSSSRHDEQELHSAPSGYLSHSPYLPTLPSEPEALGAGHYMPSFASHDSLYHKERYSGEDDSTYYSHRGSMDVWGLDDGAAAARTSLAQARERYLSRKEAALAATESAYDFKPAKPARFTPRQKKWAAIVGSLTTAIVFAIIIFFATRNKTNSTIVDPPSSSTSGDKSGKPTAGVVSTSGGDPSKFTKDPRLHHSMYGICYTPFHAQYPACGATQSNVTEDVQLLSQLTSRVRLYGSDCETSQLVLEAIKQTQVDMTVFLAVWVDDNAVTFQRQVANVVDAIAKYGTDRIAGITVGNEFLLNGGSVTTLLDHIATVNSTINKGTGKYVPIGTADAGSMVTTQLASGADYIMANVHPWFGGLPVDQAAGWVYEYTNTNAPATALLAPNKPTLYVAEAGWPTGANETRLATYQGATAGVDELNTFLASFVCQSNANVTAAGLQPSFVFEAFDEPWKDPLYGGVEAHWGLFDANKRLKDGLVIPDCQAP